MTGLICSPQTANNMSSLIQYVHDSNRCSLLFAGSLFVIASAKFIPVCIQPIDVIDAATAHRVAWTSNKQCFFNAMNSDEKALLSTVFCCVV